jgi:hypothetical protein
MLAVWENWNRLMTRTIAGILDLSFTISDKEFDESGSKRKGCDGYSLVRLQ